MNKKFPIDRQWLLNISIGQILVTFILTSISVRLIIFAIYKTEEKNIYRQKKFTEYLEQKRIDDFSKIVTEFVNQEKIALSNSRKHTIRYEFNKQISLLSKNKKKELVQILYDAKLLISNQPIINISLASLEKADFKKVDFEQIDLSFVNMMNSEFMGANLSEANLSNSYLSASSFMSANLSKADLNQSDLSSSVLISANLSHASLVKTVLIGSDLSGAYLNRANLTQADLSKANLNGASFHKANLANVSLTNANLNEADFSNAINLDPAQIKSACNWHLAKYSDSFKALLDLEPNQPTIDNVCTSRWKFEPR